MKPFIFAYTTEAKKRIQHLHPSIKQEIRKALDELKDNPWLGKALKRELSGLNAIRVKGYRVIYHINEEAGIITILTLGKRKTIYEDFAKSLRP